MPFRLKFAFPYSPQMPQDVNGATKTLPVPATGQVKAGSPPAASNSTPADAEQGPHEAEPRPLPAQSSLKNNLPQRASTMHKPTHYRSNRSRQCQVESILTLECQRRACLYVAPKSEGCAIDASHFLLGCATTCK